jgi:hypothetical protein
LNGKAGNTQVLQTRKACTRTLQPIWSEQPTPQGPQANHNYCSYDHVVDDVHPVQLCSDVPVGHCSLKDHFGLFFGATTYIPDLFNNLLFTHDAISFSVGWSCALSPSACLVHANELGFRTFPADGSYPALWRRQSDPA